MGLLPESDLSLMLTFHWLKQATWPCLSLVEEKRTVGRVTENCNLVSYEVRARVHIAVLGQLTLKQPKQTTWTAIVGTAYLARCAHGQVWGFAPRECLRIACSVPFLPFITIVINTQALSEYLLSII